jgi:hypothetical protein
MNKIEELQQKVDFLYSERLKEKNELRYWTRETKRVKNLIRLLNWLEDCEIAIQNKKLRFKLQITNFKQKLKNFKQPLQKKLWKD